MKGAKAETKGMMNALLEAIDLHSEALEPRLGLARYHLDSGRPDKVDKLFEPLLELQQRSPRVLDLAHSSSLRYG